MYGCFHSIYCNSVICQRRLRTYFTFEPLIYGVKICVNFQLFTLKQQHYAIWLLFLPKDKKKTHTHTIRLIRKIRIAVRKFSLNYIIRRNFILAMALYLLVIKTNRKKKCSLLPQNTHTHTHKDANQYKVVDLNFSVCPEINKKRFTTEN